MAMQRTGYWLAGTISLALTGIGGCMGTPLGDPLTETNTATADVLSALTAGDVADAFASFRDGLTSVAQSEPRTGITADERTKIEQLQARFDAGEITQSEFVAGVREVLQDTTPASPFAGFRFLGSPFSAAGINDFAALTGLTDAQQQQALQVYRVLHADIADVRAAAQTQIRTVLSAQQQALLSKVAQELADQANITGDQQDVPQPLFDTLVQRLGLTPDQQDQIASIQEFLRGVTADLHTQAREEFLRLLDESQLSVLNILKRP